MPEEKAKPKDEKKEPTVEEVRKSLLSELEFPCKVAEKLKRIKDAGLLDATTEMELKKTIDENIRAIMGMPAKPVPQQPVFQPPAQPQYTPPPTAPSYPPPPRR